MLGPRRHEVVSGLRVAVCWFAITAGCGGPRSTAQAQTSHAQVPNPAARRCVEDGYALEPVLADGVPIDHDCVDPSSGRRCEVWSYLRGECRLRETTPRN